MRVKLSLLLLGALVAATAPAGFAQTGVAGKWTGQLSAADGHGIAQPITIELKLDGTTLSGTVIEGALEARPIAGATVEGNNVTFRHTRNNGGADINVNWKGELKGDDLALSREIGPAPAEGGGGRGGAGGGRGGGGAAPAAGGGGGRGGRGGAAPAAGGAPPAAGQAPAAAAAAPIPPVPGADGAAPAAGGRGAAGGGRGGGGRGGAPAAAGGAAPQAGGGGRGGAAAAPAGPTVQLTLHRAK